MSCGVGCRCGLDPELLWLSLVAPIRPLAWEPPYAAEVALEMAKRQKKKKIKKDLGKKLVYRVKKREVSYKILRSQ